jgi:hypothetical protein
MDHIGSANEQRVCGRRGRPGQLTALCLYTACCGSIEIPGQVNPIKADSNFFQLILLTLAGYLKNGKKQNSTLFFFSLKLKITRY